MTVFSFLETDDLSKTEIDGVFTQAKKIKSHFIKSRRFSIQFDKNPLMALLFFEPSTRTRLSFEIATKRLGGSVTFFDGASKEGTSLIKGETYDDTFWTLHSMLPEMIVVRCGEHLNLHKLREQTKVPIVNAGYGTLSHPTQALLDVFTMLESFASIETKNILFMGDIIHSRVAQSHLMLLPRMGAQVGVVGPAALTRGTPQQVKTFSSLPEALQWADVVVGLRIQFERHQTQGSFSQAEYIEKYQLQLAHEKYLKPTSLVFHPGPVNWGLEFTPDVRQMKNFKMWDQKQNGVFVRAALLHLLAEKNGLNHG